MTARARRLIRRYPMAAFFASIYTWFGLTAAVSITATVTGGETTGTEAAVIAAAGVVSLAGMVVSVWLYDRHERRSHAEFMRRLDEPLRPSRLTVWHRPHCRPLR